MPDPLSQAEKKKASNRAWHKVWYPAHLKEAKVRRQSVSSRWTHLKNSAKDRGLLVSISFEEFKELTSSPCWYCGGMSPGYNFVGVDRLDVDEGYIPGNCVPCCSTHNYMKRGMSVAQFITECEKVVAFCGKEP
jgi:hypothetical protein